MWDLRVPGLEPVSPALGGGFLITVPPGKSLWIIFKVFIEFVTNIASVLCFDFLAPRHVES